MIKKENPTILFIFPVIIFMVLMLLYISPAKETIFDYILKESQVEKIIDPLFK